jgi:hypothetical protein
MAHTVCGQKSHGTKSLIEYWIFEYVGAGNEVHSSIGELQADTQRVIETVLVVGNHDSGGAIYGHIFKTNDMLLTEVETRIYILQIDTKGLQKERVFTRSSLHKNDFFVSSFAKGRQLILKLHKI